MSKKISHSPERRHFLKSSATVVGGSALLSSLPVSWAFANGTPETTAAKLGFIALTDAAPLFVADEKGFLKKNDLVGFMGIGSGLNCMMLGVRW